MHRRFLAGISLTFALFTGAAGAFAADDYVASIEQWRQTRVARLTKPDGWLTLIGLHWLQAGDNTVGTAADNTIQLAAGPAHFGTVNVAADGKVTFTAAADSAATIADKPAPAGGELRYQGEDDPTIVRNGTVQFFVIERSGKLALRVKDSESPRRTHFLGLDYYPIDPAWRVEAQWVQFEKPREIAITNILGQQEPAKIPGKAVFTHDGHTVELLPIDEGPAEDLFFVISDQTSGEETYGACRFIYAARAQDGKITIDFNKAYNPPCAFTSFATCPLPPKENRLPFPVRAGEKNYRGAAHH